MIIDLDVTGLAKSEQGARTPVVVIGYFVLDTGDLRQTGLILDDREILQVRPWRIADFVISCQLGS